MKWLHEVFGTSKPIIAMCHLHAFPGDPEYDPSTGMKAIVEAGRSDLKALQDGGVDAVMFSNEYSRPYQTKVETITVAAMARVIGEIMSDIRIPFGVNVLWDARASLDLAVSVGGLFVREIFSGVYASDFGLWNTNCGDTVRHQYAVSAQHVKRLYNIYPEASVYLAPRSPVDIARSTLFNTLPDGICVSGLTAGVETDASLLKQVKDAVPGTPVLANTGVRTENVKAQLSIADGAVVGTTFKKDGYIWNPVDVQRVKEFMAVVKAFRRD